MVLFDAIWPAEFYKFGLLQDVTPRINGNDSKKIFSGAMSTVTYKDKVWGLPWILDTKYLYYNKAMLTKAGITTPPQTWEQVEQQSEILKQKGIVNIRWYGAGRRRKRSFAITPPWSRHSAANSPSRGNSILPIPAP